jgi:ferredoxin
MIIDITGDENNIKKAITFLVEQEIKVNEKSEGMLWESSKCSGCGSCVPHCPTKALHVSDNRTMEVVFSNEKCIECLNCIQVCPFGACSSIF